MIAGDHAFVGSTTGAVFAVDVHTGAELWRGSTGGPGTYYEDTGYHGLAVAHDTLIVPSGTRLVAFRSAAAPPQVGLADRVTPPVDVGPAQPQPGSTTNLYGDANHTGGVNLSQPAPPLRRRWQTATSTLTALVADGRVFAIEGGYVVARSPATGAAQWATDVPGAGIGGAAYDRGRVFTVSSGGITALDAATGAVVWNDPADDTFLRGSLTALDGEVYVSHGLGTTRYRGDTGAKVWTTFNPTNYSERAPSVDATRVYLGNYCGPVSRTTGEPVSGYKECPDSSHAAVPLSNGHLMADFGSGYGGFYDLDTGRGLAVAKPVSDSPPAILGNVAVTETDNLLVGREFPGWTPRWAEKPQSAYDLAMPPLIVGRTVYAASTSPRLRALDVATGQQVWAESLGSMWLEEYDPGSSAAMAVGEGLLLLPTDSGLIAYEGI